MKMSIAICTHNRSADLKRTLQALTQVLAMSHHSAEILVVANAVTDDTLDICRRAGVRCHEEPQLGLSHARNAAVRMTKGDAILWLDDDATPHPGLIDAYIQALNDHPDSTYFGGPIELAFEGAPPRWLTSAVQLIPTAWAGLDLGDTDRAFHADRQEYPFGANMLTRRAVLTSGFRTDLGRTGTGLVGGEEAALFRALQSRGHTGRWVAGARISHRIGQDRQTLDYVARYFIGQGIQREILDESVRPSTAKAQFRIARNWLRYRLSRLSVDPKHWLRAYTELNQAKGRNLAHKGTRLETTGTEGV